MAFLLQQPGGEAVVEQLADLVDINPTYCVLLSWPRRRFPSLLLAFSCLIYLCVILRTRAGKQRGRAGERGERRGRRGRERKPGRAASGIRSRSYSCEDASHPPSSPRRYDRAGQRARDTASVAKGGLCEGRAAGWAAKRGKGAPVMTSQAARARPNTCNVCPPDSFAFSMSSWPLLRLERPSLVRSGPPSATRSLSVALSRALSLSHNNINRLRGRSRRGLSAPPASLFPTQHPPSPSHPLPPWCPCAPPPSPRSPPCRSVLPTTCCSSTLRRAWPWTET